MAERDRGEACRPEIYPGQKTVGEVLWGMYVPIHCLLYMKYKC